MLIASSPSAMWFATRGAGAATLVALTASVVLGISTAGRWGGGNTPRFVVASWHRTVGLVAILLVVVHVATTVLDPFAKISIRDAIVPFTAAYRPVWLGLGVVAAEVLIAIALSSVLRGRLGPRTWRALHWTAYAVWPMAMVHGLGTGSDAQVPWMIGITAGCLAAVVVALALRLGTGRLRTLPLRVALAVVATASLAAIGAWAVRGPFQPGWATASGTPASLLQVSPRTPTARPPGRPFSDALIGTMVRDQQGRPQVALRDVVDPAITLAIRPPSSTETLPVLTVARNGRTLCVTPTRVQTSFYAVCGSTRLVIVLRSAAGRVTGGLTSSGPLT